MFADKRGVWCVKRDRAPLSRLNVDRTKHHRSGRAPGLHRSRWRNMRNVPGLKVQPGQRLCLKSSGHLCPGNEDNDDEVDVDGDGDDDNEALQSCQTKNCA